jgi:hypothetical protein
VLNLLQSEPIAKKLYNLLVNRTCMKLEELILNVLDAYFNRTYMKLGTTDGMHQRLV